MIKLKLVRFVSPTSEKAVIGVLIDDDKVIDLNLGFTHFSKKQGEDKDKCIAESVNELLVKYSEKREVINKVIEFVEKRTDVFGTIMFNLGDVRLLSPLDTVRKIIGLAGNYKTHGPSKKPERPLLFSKNPGTGIVEPNQEIVVPDTIEKLDYEIELGVVIGKKGRFIPFDKAYDHVGGYTVFNDVCDRYFLSSPRDWYGMKAQDNFSVFGPCVQTEVTDPHNLKIRLKVNDELRQDGNTEDMHFTIPELIQFISGLVTLEPGDIIATGTCFGTAMEREREGTSCWLKDGDIIEAEIEQIGLLNNVIKVVKPIYEC